MVAELWRTFPKMIVRNINGLLEDAEPNALRSLQIYRRLKNENLSAADVSTFSRQIGEFFALARADRRKSQFDQFLERPMSAEVFSLFQLDFHSAAVSESAVETVASWAHNLIRVSKKTTSAFMSLDVMRQTIRKVTSPSRNEKGSNLEFHDFTSAWKRTVARVCGTTDDAEFGNMLRELQTFHEELRARELIKTETQVSPGIYLTQPEIDWAIAVRDAVEANEPIPPLQLANENRLQPLRNLEKVVRLYALARSSQVPEVLRNRDRIRATVLHQCAALLGEDKKLAS